MSETNAIIMLGRLGKFGNIVLMGLLPIALTAPLAVSEVEFWFYSHREEISISGSLAALHKSGDMLLFYVILCLSVVGPYLRLSLMTYAAFSSAAAAMRIRPLLELVGRFSLIDVIIISLLVISFRVPEFKLQWGFYLVLGLWVLDMLSSWAIWTRLTLDAERARRVRDDWPETEPARPARAAPSRRSRDGAAPKPAAAQAPPRRRRKKAEDPAPTGAPQPRQIAGVSAAEVGPGDKKRPRLARTKKKSEEPAPTNAPAPTDAPAQIAGVESVDGASGRAAALASEVTDRMLDAAGAAPRAFERLRAAFARPDRSSEND